MDKSGRHQAKGTKSQNENEIQTKSSSGFCRARATSGDQDDTAFGFEEKRKMSSVKKSGKRKANAGSQMRMRTARAPKRTTLDFEANHRKKRASNFNEEAWIDPTTKPPRGK